MEDAWIEKAQALQEFADFTNSLAVCYGEDPTTLQKFTIAVSQESLAAMQLLLRRPLHKCHSGSFLRNDSFDILRAATEVLERSLMKRTSTEFAQWAWYSWVKWYALAVVLAELCGHVAIGSGDVDRAWTAAEECYGNYAQAVADAESGLLWKPITKLMHVAQTVREKTSASTDLQSWSESQMQIEPAADFNPLYQGEDVAWMNWNTFIDDMHDPPIMGYDNDSLLDAVRQF
jgi:hypothetical protein